MMEEKKCYICGANSFAEANPMSGYTRFECEACGRFLINLDKNSIDNNFLPSFLYYNCKTSLPVTDKRYFFFLGSKEKFEEIQKECPYACFVTNQEAENWYPRTFSEKIDKIVLGFSKLSKYDGNPIEMTYEQYCSAFFVKRYNSDDSETNREERDNQIKFIENYLLESNFIKVSANNSERILITLLPAGLKRIDELQKNQSSNSKNVFVAMSFASNMKEVREAIRKAILDAGYSPIIMDEIEHNKQIVPEMLYEIRQSKFVVAEFTGHNNGAYYEAGYAAGLGKEVIHICEEKSFNEGIHFDLKQINTIRWETKKEAELTENLLKRIKAIIG